MCLKPNYFSKVIMVIHKQPGPLYSEKTSYTLGYRIIVFLSPSFSDLVNKSYMKKRRVWLSQNCPDAGTLDILQDEELQLPHHRFCLFMFLPHCSCLIRSVWWDFSKNFSQLYLVSDRLLVAQETFPGFGNMIVLKPRTESISLQETSSYQQIALWKTQRTVMLNIRVLFRSRQRNKKKRKLGEIFPNNKGLFYC